ncbi:translesion DNA synthesis-associated protein ImuA [Limnobacter sp.]|uniref:translesion DNA synthesis-associated protein ImuA n=1 Tax=Limnobacter sp. TaxID=2003368 RepID=UPI0035183F00
MPNESSTDPLGIHPSLWRANQLGSDTTLKIPSGFPELDLQLPGGGWPTRNLIELLLKHQGIGELRFLMPVLRRLSLEQKKLVLVGAPHIPMAAVFEHFGVALQQITLIQTHKPQDRLWAMEQVLQSDAFGALVMWLPEDKALCSPPVLRRLQYQASRSSGLSFVFRPLQAQHQPSPASLRICLTAYSPHQLRVQLIKRRGPVLEHPLVLQLPQSHRALPGLVFEHELARMHAIQHAQESGRALDRHVHTATQRDTQHSNP